MELTHVEEEGRARMVDVGGKLDTERVAVARGEVTMRPETLRLIAEGKLRVAGRLVTCAGGGTGARSGGEA